MFFDHFAYQDSTDERLARRGWTVRSGTGGPGMHGVTWSTAAVAFPTVDGRQVLQLTTSTDDTAAGTVHAEVFQQRKFRVYFVKDRALTPHQIAARIAGYRAAAVCHVGTVPLGRATGG